MIGAIRDRDQIIELDPADKLLDALRILSSEIKPDLVHDSTGIETRTALNEGEILSMLRELFPGI